MAELTFELLDDLALAAATGKGEPARHLSGAVAKRLAPLVELEIASRDPQFGDLRFETTLPSTGRSLLSRLRSKRRGSAIDKADGLSAGLIWTSRDPADLLDAQWVAFRLEAQNAMVKAGFPRSTAQKLVGAMQEIEDNVHRHSQRSHDAIVGFSCAPGSLEFVVGDAGIGVLASLRSHADYEGLHDAGAAMHIAITDGNSRYGKNSGCGHGFRDLFGGLAALGSHLRFRSGDHALTVSGESPQPGKPRIEQRAPIQGFVVSCLALLP